MFSMCRVHHCDRDTIIDFSFCMPLKVCHALSSATYGWDRATQNCGRCVGPQGTYNLDKRGSCCA